MLQVSSGFLTLENNKTTRPAASWFQMFLASGNLMKPSHSFFKYYVTIAKKMNDKVTLFGLKLFPVEILCEKTNINFFNI